MAAAYVANSSFIIMPTDAEQTMTSNLLINIKVWIQLGPLVTYEGDTQVFCFPKFLLVWEP